jgi:tetratricopeptide (TPR) repeat protein
MDPERTPSPLSSSRRWLFRALLGLVLPVVFLLTAEFVLRFAGYGHPASMLVRKQAQGQTVLVDNPWFGLSFFPPALARSPNPTRIAADKPKGVYRIFLFGESAAMGDPRPSYGVGRYLETLLRLRFPKSQFEVVCVAMTAINSHAILPIARECANYQGDLWIVYMGNNEFAGPFGANTVFGQQVPPAMFVRAYLQLQRTRLGQWLVACARRLHVSQTTPASWEGLKMFVNHELPPEDPRRDRVYHNFEHNLRDLARVACDSHIPVVLSGMACNLQDCAPFGSSQAEHLKEDGATQWSNACDEGTRNANAGNLKAALNFYQQALELNRSSADVWFNVARCDLALTKVDSARAALRRARDLDTLPFRADSHLNQIIETVAKESSGKGVCYADAEAALGGRSASGLPGRESFYEHVHLNPEGNYHLARTFADQAIQCLPASIRQTDTQAWPDASECHQQLGLTDWNRSAILEEILKRISEPPFTRQLEHGMRMDELRAALNELASRMNAPAAQAAHDNFVRILKDRPQDPWLHHNFAEFLARTGDLDQAAAQLRQVCELLPDSYAGFLQLGRLLGRQKKYDEAQTTLEQALRLRPDTFDVRLELGQVLAARNKLEEAMTEFKQAQKLHGGDQARLLLLQADIRARQHNIPEAVTLLRQSVQLKPDYSDAHELLGIELAADNQFSDAEVEFEKLVRLRPDYAEGRVNLGISLARQQKYQAALEQFKRALELDPKNTQAQEFITAVRALQAQAGSR